MLYLKNTLGGLSRSLTDSALHSFQGRHRWWKLALFAGLFVLPGGSVGVALLAWVEHRRSGKRAKRVDGALVQSATNALTDERIQVAAKALAAPALNAAPTSACHARGDAACRAAAGKVTCRRKETQAGEARG
ncbi:hypothetical protein LJ656_12075 [Paraburkholderia sp. MMS20-SJTR3]|uniref:Uncharacterized protein n=1 Tax=Paraburkholderia sejongensis TaxID=2886946 RepID=A0ABS8JTU2_9BURK|nr:hypothetical protein [Paraburkholderia sp. MMS20-SJTR3]MCC8393331.1 hypothetical protein [Paraburkholderia sp. MMS20-SJTR3]